MKPQRILQLAVLVLVVFSANDVNAEEVTGQEQEIGLYLYSENGIGKLHTRESPNHGDTDQVSIQPGSSYFFSLNHNLQADLESKSYRTDVGFHIYLYANSANFNTGHLNIYVRDGTTMTSGELIATGEMDIPSALQSNNEGYVDVFWEEDYGPTHQFDIEHFIVLELENDGDNAINLELDTGKDGEAPSRLIATTNPVTNIEIITESYNLETSDLEDFMSTDKFQPNLPVNLSEVFVSAQALNAFGTYDITEFKVTVFDSDDNELFVRNTAIEEPEDNSSTNDFEEITWNYNDPSEPSENHNGKGIYTVRVAAIDQQGNEFYLEKYIQMDAYGIYLSTPKVEQDIPVGNAVFYQILVRNSGDENDKFTIEPSDTSNDWAVSPQTWTSYTLSPGEEQSVTFTVLVADSTEMVGKNTIIVFTGLSENSVTPVNFGLTTSTSVVVANNSVDSVDFSINFAEEVLNLDVRPGASGVDCTDVLISNLGTSTIDVDIAISGGGVTISPGAISVTLEPEGDITIPICALALTRSIAKIVQVSALASGRDTNTQLNQVNKNASFTVSIDPYARLSIQSQTPYSSHCIFSTFKTNFTAVNNGNTNDTVVFEIANIQELEDAGFIVALAAAQYQINVSGEQFIQVTIYTEGTSSELATKFVAAGSYNITGRISTTMEGEIEARSVTATITMENCQKQESNIEGAPSISLIPALISIGLIAISRRK